MKREIRRKFPKLRADRPKKEWWQVAARGAELKEDDDQEEEEQSSCNVVASGSGSAPRPRPRPRPQQRLLSLDLPPSAPRPTPPHQSATRPNGLISRGGRVTYHAGAALPPRPLQPTSLSSARTASHKRGRAIQDEEDDEEEDEQRNQQKVKAPRYSCRKAGASGSTSRAQAPPRPQSQHHFEHKPRSHPRAQTLISSLPTPPPPALKPNFLNSSGKKVTYGHHAVAPRSVSPEKPVLPLGCGSLSAVETKEEVRRNGGSMERQSRFSTTPHPQGEKSIKEEEEEDEGMAVYWGEGKQIEEGEKPSFRTFQSVKRELSAADAMEK
jgi:hypothetical protein